MQFSEKIFCYSDQIKKFPSTYRNKLVIINPLVRKEYYQSEIKKIDKLIKPDVIKALKIENSVNSKTSYGGTSIKNVVKMLKKLKKENALHGLILDLRKNPGEWLEQDLLTNHKSAAHILLC